MIRKENIPEFLKSSSRWCVWRYGAPKSNGKRAKLPFNPLSEAMADPSDPSTFGTFDEAFKAASEGRYDGIGIMVSGNIGAIDIDHCIDDNGAINEVATNILEAIPSAYAEISPSNSGIRMFVIIAGEYTDKEGFKQRYRINNRDIGLEVYVPGITSRYVTVTGNMLREGDVPHNPEGFKNILNRYMLKSVDDLTYTQMELPTGHEANRRDTDKKVYKSFLTDEQVIDIASTAANKDKFISLFEGRWEGLYGSASEADLGLCQMLAFYCANDEDQIDSLYRKSGLLRDKWDRKEGENTYGKMTIAKAINSNTATYKPPYKKETRNEIPAQKDAICPRSISISAVDLQASNIPPIRWIVDQLLTEGLSLLVAPPKSYKSFLGIQLCLAITQGKEFLGFKTHRHACLYFDLESGHRRPRDRVNMMLNTGTAPDNLYFVTAEEKPGILGNGFETVLKNELMSHPDIALVIIDVFTKIRALKGGSTNVYERDYADLATIKGIADVNHVSVLLIHHTRKASDTGDIYNMISGSTAIFGAADVTWMISRQKRNDLNAILHVTGRDVEDMELSISFNKKRMQWQCNGTVEEHEHNQLNLDYSDSNLVQTILAELQNNGGRYEASATQILADGIKSGYPINEDPRQIGQLIKRYQALLLTHDGIIYEFKRTGAERLYIFTFVETIDDGLPFQ